jgi:tripartite-type tricarboxylate transporter receptor subunit TctC
MQTSRRHFLTTAGYGLVACALPRSTWAQSFPSRPVRMIVPYPVGGTTDLITRRVGQALAARWEQPVVIENKPGAGTLIGAEAVARAPADGYALLATAEATFAVNPYVYRKLPYQLADFVPISGLGISTQVLVVHAATPMASVSEVVAAARAKSGGLSYGTFGVGSSAHLNMEMLQAVAGVSLTPIHYTGAAPMLNDLIAGHIPMAFVGISLAAGPMKSGQLRVVGSGGRTRLPQFPEIPTLAESGLADFQAISWFGIFAPRKTPEHIVDQINTDVQRVLSDPEFNQKFLDPVYLQPLMGSPRAFAEYVRADAAKWSRIIASAKISIE